MPSSKGDDAYWGCAASYKIIKDYQLENKNRTLQYYNGNTKLVAPLELTPANISDINASNDDPKLRMSIEL